MPPPEHEPLQEQLLDYARLLSLRQHVLRSQGRSDFYHSVDTAASIAETEMLPEFCRRLQDENSYEHNSFIRQFEHWKSPDDLEGLVINNADLQESATLLSLRRAALFQWLKSLQKDGRPLIDFRNRHFVEMDFAPLDRTQTVLTVVEQVQFAHVATKNLIPDQQRLGSRVVTTLQ